MATLDLFHIETHGWDRATQHLESALGTLRHEVIGTIVSVSQNTKTVSLMEDAYSRVNSPPYKHNRSQRGAVKQGTGYQHIQRGLVIAKFCQHFASQPSSLPSPSPCKISSVCGFKVCHGRAAMASSREIGICYSKIGHSRVLTKTFASANCIPFEISPPCLLSGHRGHYSDCDRRSGEGGMLVSTML